MSIPPNKLTFVDHPEEHTGDPERDLLYRALLEVENREGEKRGWDNPPAVWGVYLKNTATYTAIELRPIPYPWAQLGREFGYELQVMTKNLPDPPDDLTPLRFADSPGGFAGAVALAEGWMLESVTDEEHERIEAGARIADMTDRRIEVRSMFGADLNGHPYFVNRRRGEQPKVWPESAVKLGGRIIESLQRLAYAHRTGALEAEYQRTHRIAHGVRP